MYFPHQRLQVHIHAHPTPIRVSYQTVRALIPLLLFPPLPPPEENPPPSSATHEDGDNGGKGKEKEQPNFDIVLFIGMASGRKFFTLESRAHRDGYAGRDVDGKTMEGDELWQGGAYQGAPEVLETGFPVGEVLKKVKARLLEEDIRQSDDAGHYLCDFIYYTGLVEYWRRDPKGERPVMFLHVPGEAEGEDLLKGRTVALELIRTLVESRRMKREEGG
ncbi:MAG: hypothetical protein Q9187_006388 [Circinaria calcarea]